MTRHIAGRHVRAHICAPPGVAICGGTLKTADRKTRLMILIVVLIFVAALYADDFWDAYRYFAFSEGVSCFVRHYINLTALLSVVLQCFVKSSASPNTLRSTDPPILKTLKEISDRTMIQQASLIRLGIKKVISEYSAALRK